jgi:hypothetical protein
MLLGLALALACAPAGVLQVFCTLLSYSCSSLEAESPTLVARCGASCSDALFSFATNEMFISARLLADTIGPHTSLGRGACIYCSVTVCCVSGFQSSPQPFVVLPHAAFCAAFCSILVGGLSLLPAAIHFVLFPAAHHCLLLRSCLHIIPPALIVSVHRHVLATPRTSVSWAVCIIVATVWCIYGLSCLSSMIVSRKNAIMLAVVLCMIPAALCVCLCSLSRQFSREA